MRKRPCLGCKSLRACHAFKRENCLAKPVMSSSLPDSTQSPNLSITRRMQALKPIIMLTVMLPQALITGLTLIMSGFTSLCPITSASCNFFNNYPPLSQALASHSKLFLQPRLLHHSRLVAMSSTVSFAVTLATHLSGADISHHCDEAKVITVFLEGRIIS